jgi:hypothetical protein
VIAVLEVGDDVVTCECRVLVPIGAPACPGCGTAREWRPLVVRPYLDGQRTVRVVRGGPVGTVLLVGTGWGEAPGGGASAAMIRAIRAALTAQEHAALLALLGRPTGLPVEANVGAKLPAWAAGEPIPG